MNNEQEIRLQLEKWRGYSAYEIAVKNGYIGTEEEWAESLKNSAGKATVNGIAQDENYNIQVYLKDIPMRDSTTRNAQEEMDLKFDSGDLVQEPEKGGKGWPLSAEAGKAIYEVAKARAKVLTQKVTLRLDSWTSEDDEYVQSVEVEGVVADADKASLIITPGEGREMEALYVDYEVRAKEQGDGTVKFSCTSQPAAHIDVNVMVVLLGQELYEAPGTGDGSSGGSGADGFSPTVTVERVGTATILTIVDVNGKKVATIEDGKTGAAGPAGANGKDGFSPVVEMIKEGDTANIIITDATGPKSVLVFDGKDGEAGPAGADGKDAVSPTVTAEKNGTVTTLTITDVNGTRTANINDGADGQNGQDGPAGADGFSPRVTMSKRDGTATVSIIDAAGPHSVELYDGAQGPQGPAGADGKDGVSPRVTVQKSGKVATITVLDADNIEKQVSIYDGADGKTGDVGPQGPVGEAGFTPIVSLTKEGKATTLLITDKENSHVAVIYDGATGEKGEKGDQGEPGVRGPQGEPGISPSIQVSENSDGATIVIEDASGNIQAVNILNGKDGDSSVNIKNGTGENSLRTTGAAPEDDTYKLGKGSFAHGSGTKASGMFAHAEGYQTQASGYIAHAEGLRSIASGDEAHAEGIDCIASGARSHAEGYMTRAVSDNQHVQGKFNAEDTEGRYAHIVGNGPNGAQRSNIHTVGWDGSAWFKGKVYVGGTSQDDAEELGGGHADWSAKEGEKGHVLNRTHWAALVDGVEILPVTTFAEADMAEEGLWAITSPLGAALVPDTACTVLWNGTEYACSVQSYTEEGYTICFIGNGAPMFGGEDTGLPFFFAPIPDDLPGLAPQGVTAQLIALDGATSVTMSVTGTAETVQELDGKYVKTAIEAATKHFVKPYDPTEVTIGSVLFCVDHYPDGTALWGPTNPRTLMDSAVQNPVTRGAVTLRDNGDYGMTSEFFVLNGSGSPPYVDGVIVRSPNGTRWKISVDDSGTLTTTAL